MVCSLKMNARTRAQLIVDFYVYLFSSINKNPNFIAARILTNSYISMHNKTYTNARFIENIEQTTKHCSMEIEMIHKFFDWFQ